MGGAKQGVGEAMGGASREGWGRAVGGASTVGWCGRRVGRASTGRGALLGTHGWIQ